MTDEVRRVRNEYMREWRSKNKDKVKAIQDKYWENKLKKLNYKGEK